MPKTKNSALNAAKKAKKDEFYTQLADIENECRHYREHFRGKTILCNCDDPRVSNFWRYFTENFEFLGLKKVIATCYKNQAVDLFTQQNSERAIYQIYEGDTNGDLKVTDDEIAVHELEGDGDFRSPECLKLLDEADIVVTNPPFSLLREFVLLMVKHKKKFLIIGQQNAIHYADIFPLLQNGEIWLGYKSGDMAFRVPPSSEPRETRFWIDEHGQKWRSMGNACWFTNLDIKKRHEMFISGCHYSVNDYKTLDNYDAIFIKKLTEMPDDYDGVMAVPITFMARHNPAQYEILGTSTLSMSKGAPYLDGKRLYERILIRRRRSDHIL